MSGLTQMNLTDDTLKNIFLMAPMLDEAGQNKVFGLMCGLVACDKSPKKGQRIKDRPNQKAG